MLANDPAVVRYLETVEFTRGLLALAADDYRLARHDPRHWDLPTVRARFDEAQREHARAVRLDIGFQHWDPSVPQWTNRRAGAS